MARVLVTGGTGFVGAHCLIQLLAAGHETRTTVRDLKREGEARAMLRQGGAGDVGERLTFVRADLSADSGWAEAIRGCDYVLHVASPFPVTVPKDENELIVPARDGALRVLKASRDAAVKRVVLTSSFVAIGYGAPKDRTAVFTENDWTNLNDPSVQPYGKSKTIAERAAWDFAASEGGDTELVVVNPTFILGPPLTAETGSSMYLIKAMFGGEMSVVPRHRFGIADVRDVADVHIRAMAAPGAAGKRFIAVSDHPAMSYLELAGILRRRFGSLAARVPTEEAPGDELPRLVIRNDRAKNELGWRPRPAETTIADTVENLRDRGELPEQ